MENAAAQAGINGKPCENDGCKWRRGGRAEQLPALLKRIKEQPRDREVATETKYTPWDRPYFFLIVVGLLCVEWYLTALGMGVRKGSGFSEKRR